MSLTQVSGAGPTARAVPGRWRYACRLAGVVVGLVVATVLWRREGLGISVLLAAPALAVSVLAGVVVGELTVRPPRTATRSAALEVRRPRDYLPRALTAAVLACGIALLGLLVATTLAGSPDDLGRPGRSLVRVCDAAVTESHGPWAGRYYTAPLAAVLAAGALAAWWTLRTVARRPRPGGDAAAVAADDRRRRESARAVMGACGVLVAVPLIGVAAVTAGGLDGISCAPSWWDAAARSLLAAVPVLLGMLAWFAAAVLVPASA